jgi:hypothetical protein
MDFPDVVNVAKTLPAVWHYVKHHIKTSRPPIAFRLRRLEGANLEAAHHEFEAMERDVVIKRSTSPWASSCVSQERQYVEAMRGFSEAEPHH